VWTAWLGRASFLGLFWCGKRADLPEQAKLVLHIPLLGDLASLYPNVMPVTSTSLPVGGMPI
jgi:hypothetical protein